VTLSDLSQLYHHSSVEQIVPMMVQTKFRCQRVSPMVLHMRARLASEHMRRPNATDTATLRHSSLVVSASELRASYKRRTEHARRFDAAAEHRATRHRNGAQVLSAGQSNSGCKCGVTRGADRESCNVVLLAGCQRLGTGYLLDVLVPVGRCRTTGCSSNQ
jgi:hypothetical protein